MNIAKVLICCLLGFSTLWSYNVFSELNTINYSDEIISGDVLDNIAKRIKAKKYYLTYPKSEDDSSLDTLGVAYKKRNLLDYNVHFRFIKEKKYFHKATVFNAFYYDRLASIKVDKNKSLTAYKIKLKDQLFSPYHYGVETFLNSAYIQEIDENYVVERASIFIDLDTKSHSGFWVRNLISQGWGSQYIYHKNPFTDGGWLPTTFGYLSDAIAAAFIVSGPLIKDDLKGQLSISLTGVVYSLTAKFLFNGLFAKSHMNAYNDYVSSGYKIPKYVFKNEALKQIGNEKRRFSD